MANRVPTLDARDGFIRNTRVPTLDADNPLPMPRPKVFYCVSWDVEGQGRFGQEYADLAKAQWNARDIEGYSHIHRVRIEEVYEDRPLREGVFPYEGQHNPRTRFKREEPI